MKLQILSDLHLDCAMSRLRKVEADLTLLAGDHGNGLTPRLRAFLDHPRNPVLAVLGNHDYYGQDWERGRELWQGNAGNAGIQLLDPGTYDHGPFRILGCTLWTGLNWMEDDARTGRTYDYQETVDRLPQQLSDFTWIRSGPERLAVQQMIDRHHEEVAWLEGQKAQARADGKRIIVMTHFGPSRRSCHPRYAGDRLNPYFTNSLDWLTRDVELWVQGHTHSSLDYVIPETMCRVICNPRGYNQENKGAFDHQLVVELKE